jgi:hypothetical protein
MSNSQFEIRDWVSEPDEILLHDAAICLDLAWALLRDVNGRAAIPIANSLDNSQLRDLMRRVMDAKLEVDVLKIRTQNRTESAPVVRSGVGHDR